MNDDLKTRHTIVAATSSTPLSYWKLYGGSWGKKSHRRAVAGAAEGVDPDEDEEDQTEKRGRKKLKVDEIAAGLESVAALDNRGGAVLHRQKSSFVAKLAEDTGVSERTIYRRAEGLKNVGKGMDMCSYCSLLACLRAKERDKPLHSSHRYLREAAEAAEAAGQELAVDTINAPAYRQLLFHEQLNDKIRAAFQADIGAGRGVGLSCSLMSWLGTIQITLRTTTHFPAQDHPPLQDSPHRKTPPSRHRTAAFFPFHQRREADPSPQARPSLPPARNSPSFPSQRRRRNDDETIVSSKR